MNQVTPGKAWSHSALTAFETCPKRYWHLSVQKDVQEQPSDQMAWGDEVHKAFQARLTKGKKFPVGMLQFEPLVAPLLKLPNPTVETKMALDHNLNASDYFGDHVWVRIIVDAAFFSPDRKRVLLLDWKTGKRQSGDDQLALMAGVMMAQIPELEHVEAAFVWVSQPLQSAFSRSTFTREDIPAIWERFLSRVKVYQAAHRNTDFPPNPGYLCKRYCPVTKCPYHGG